MVRSTPTQQHRDTEPQLVRVRGRGMIGKLMAGAVAVVAVAVLIVVLSAVSLLPRLHNPFGETTSVRSQPVLLKSITALSRYQAASGSFQVVVNLTQKANLLPAFLEGSQTLFVGQGSEIAYVDFGRLKGPAIQVSADRTAVTIRPAPAGSFFPIAGVAECLGHAGVLGPGKVRALPRRPDPQRSTGRLEGPWYGARPRSRIETPNRSSCAYAAAAWPGS